MKITVIGLGHVGTVAAAGLAAAGHRVLGVDVDAGRLDALGSGVAPFYEPGLAQQLADAVGQGRLRFRHPDRVDEDLGAVALIAVGTPPAPGGGADLRQVAAALAWIKSRQTPNPLPEPPPKPVVVMKSTVPPGAGRRLAARELAGTGLRYVANPEFLREGRAVADWQSPDRIVIGIDPDDGAAAAVVEAMHAGIDAPRLVTDVTSAELIKYASNAFLATRISFINEIAALCDSVGASIDAVSEGLALDYRTGARIYAGVGYGGSCFPQDLRVLDRLARASGIDSGLLRSVIGANNRQRRRPLRALRQRFGGALSGLRVGVLGLAFKPGTDDVRDAPALDLIRALAEEGATVRAFDPRAMAAAAPHLPAAGGAVGLVDSVAAAAQDARALALLTEWDEIVASDWRAVAQSMLPPRFLFDGRNALDPGEMRDLGFDYRGVGRGAGRNEAPLSTARAMPPDASGRAAPSG